MGNEQRAGLRLREKVIWLRLSNTQIIEGFFI